MTGAGEHRTLRHRSCSAPTALDGQQHRRSAGERHDRDRYRGHVRAGRRQRRLGFVVGLATVFRSVTGLVAGLVRIRVAGSGLGRVIRTGSVGVRFRSGSGPGAGSGSGSGVAYSYSKSVIRLSICATSFAVASGLSITALTSFSSASFQSTHPVRGATYRRLLTFPTIQISIHAPREGCDAKLTKDRTRHAISIHACLCSM